MAVKKSEEKKTTKRTTAKNAVILQFAGKEIDVKSLQDQVKQIWTKELGNKVNQMQDVKIYVKPEEGSAYYVINGETTGSIEL